MIFFKKKSNNKSSLNIQDSNKKPLITTSWPSSTQQPSQKSSSDNNLLQLNLLDDFSSTIDIPQLLKEQEKNSNCNTTNRLNTSGSSTQGNSFVHNNNVEPLSAINDKNTQNSLTATALNEEDQTSSIVMAATICSKDTESNSTIDGSEDDKDKPEEYKELFVESGVKSNNECHQKGDDSSLTTTDPEGDINLTPADNRIAAVIPLFTAQKSIYDYCETVNTMAVKEEEDELDVVYSGTTLLADDFYKKEVHQREEEQSSPDHCCLKDVQLVLEQQRQDKQLDTYTSSSSANIDSFRTALLSTISKNQEEDSTINKGNVHEDDDKLFIKEAPAENNKKELLVLDSRPETVISSLRIASYKEKVHEEVVNCGNNASNIQHVSLTPSNDENDEPKSFSKTTATWLSNNDENDACSCETTDGNAEISKEIAKTTADEKNNKISEIIIAKRRSVHSLIPRKQILHSPPASTDAEAVVALPVEADTFAPNKKTLSPSNSFTSYQQQQKDSSYNDTKRRRSSSSFIPVPNQQKRLSLVMTETNIPSPTTVKNCWSPSSSSDSLLKRSSISMHSSTSITSSNSSTTSSVTTNEKRKGLNNHKSSSSINLNQSSKIPVFTAATASNNHNQQSNIPKIVSAMSNMNAISRLPIKRSPTAV